MSSKNKNLFILFLLILVSQLYVPVIYMGSGIYTRPDILLIFLTYLSTQNSRFFLILIGFSFGLIQDLITQSNLLGLFSFTKSVIAYILGTLNKYNRLWTSRVKALFLFSTYFIHYFISSYLSFNRLDASYIYILKISIIEALSMFIILYIVNRFILIDNKVID